jgi:predicted Zn-dependent peptidase
MLSTYLTGDKSSLMIKELVDRQQKAVLISGRFIEYEEGGIFVMELEPNIRIEPKALEAEVNWLIKQVQNKGIPDEEFTKLKNIMENDIVSKNSTMLGIAQNLAEAKVIFGNTEYINEVMEAYAKVTKEDIQRVAKTYLDRTSRVVLYYLPKSAEPAVE